MKIYVYKGFDSEFLSKINFSPLINSNIGQKNNYLSIDISKIAMDIISKSNEDGEYWMTYEEYQVGLNALNYINEKDIIILKNNIYPDIYPLYSDVSEDLYKEYLDNVDEDTKVTNVSDNFSVFKKFYNSLEKIDDLFYVTYYNEEYNNYKITDVKNYYESNIEICDVVDGQTIDFEVTISGDMFNYIECLKIIKENNYKKIGIKEIISNEASSRIKNSLFSYSVLHGITIYNSNSFAEKPSKIRSEINNIANELLYTNEYNPNPLNFYKNTYYIF